MSIEGKNTNLTVLILPILAIIVGVWPTIQKKLDASEEKSNAEWDTFKNNIIKFKVYFLSKDYALAFNEDEKRFNILYFESGFNNNKEFIITPISNINYHNEDQTIVTGIDHNKLTSSSSTRTKTVTKYYVEVEFENGSKQKIKIESENYLNGRIGASSNFDKYFFENNLKRELDN